MERYESQEFISNYVKYRPKLVKEIASTMTSYLERYHPKLSNNKWDTLVDVGCGSGQATELLAPYFNKVYGFDINENQIKMAKFLHKNKCFNFSIAQAEDLPIANDSVDLVSCSVAAHWLDYDRFVKETWRVLKPNGAVAMFCYFPSRSYVSLRNGNTDVSSGEMMTKCLLETKIFLNKCHGHPKVIHHMFNTKYEDLFNNLPGKDKTSDTSIILRNEYTLAELRGFYITYAGYQTYIIEKTKELASKGAKFTKEHDILEDFIQGLKNLWGLQTAQDEDVPISFNLKTRIIMSRK